MLYILYSFAFAIINMVNTFFFLRRIISPSPNTYTYTKRLTEILLVKYASKLPIVIARPTIGKIY